MKRILTVLLLLCTVSLTLDAARVKGSVSSNGSPLENVIVSDGYSFTTTAQDGSFKLNTNKDARYVFVITPSGYVADFSSGAPHFYIPIEKKQVYEFNLLPFGDDGDYTIFSVSDPQMQNEKHVKRFKGKPLEDLCSTAEEYSAKRQTIGIALGDIAWNRLEMFDTYKEAITSTKIPFYSVIGNHDFIQNLDGTEAAASYEKAFGPYNYAFFIGKDIVIGVNNILFKGNKTGKPEKSSNNYKEGYSKETLDFVKGLLEYIPEDAHIYMAQHSPIRILQTGKKKFIANADTMLDILGDRKVDILSGHTHLMLNQDINDNVTDHNAAAIGGAWWATDWCRDGTPRGYHIITSESGNIRWDWHNLDYPDSFQVRFIGREEAILNDGCVMANVWQADKSWKIEWYQDDVYMGEAKQVWEISPDYFLEIMKVYKGDESKIPGYKKAQPQYHFYAAEPSKDAKSVKMIVKAPDGREWTHDFNLEK